MTDSSDHVAKNRAYWETIAADFIADGERAWASDPRWGSWGVPDAELGVLPDDVTGLDVVELGCGTGYISAWLARRGARPVGIDNSPAQLATARRLQAKHGASFPLHLGNAEATPFEDASFDLAISEFGAALWCDPHRWIPEAARILRPGGQLIFLTNSTLMTLATPDGNEPITNRLVRPQRGMHRFAWPGASGVEFYLGHGDWLRLLRRSGFAVEDLIEVYPSETAEPNDHPSADLAWSRRWPVEEVWKARKWM